MVLLEISVRPDIRVSALSCDHGRQNSDWCGPTTGGQIYRLKEKPYMAPRRDHLQLPLDGRFSKYIQWKVCKLGFFFFFKRFGGQMTLGKKTDLNRFESFQMYCRIFQDLHRDGGCSFAPAYLTTELCSQGALGNATLKHQWT